MMCNLEQIGSSLQAKQMRKLRHLWYIGDPSLRQHRLISFL